LLFALNAGWSGRLAQFIVCVVDSVLAPSGNWTDRISIQRALNDNNATRAGNAGGLASLAGWVHQGGT